jgi:hypothetical protein
MHLLSICNTEYYYLLAIGKTKRLPAMTGAGRVYYLNLKIMKRNSYFGIIIAVINLNRNIFSHEFGNNLYTQKEKIIPCID